MDSKPLYILYYKTPIRTQWTKYNYYVLNNSVKEFNKLKKNNPAIEIFIKSNRTNRVISTVINSKTGKIKYTDLDSHFPKKLIKKKSQLLNGNKIDIDKLLKINQENIFYDIPYFF